MTNPLRPSSRLPLLLLLLLTPGVGLAARETPLVRPEARDVVSVRQLPLAASSTLPGTQERASLRLREDSWAEEDARPPRGLRILAEVGAGLLTGVGGGFVGLLAGAGLCTSGGFGCLGSAFGGMLLGFGAGYSLGVFWGGEAAGGDGKLLGALAGLGVGLAAGTLLALATRQSDFILLLTVPCSLIGSHIGYELSQRERAPAPEGQAPMRAPEMASARPRLQPVLGFSRDGALVGLGGSF